MRATLGVLRERGTLRGERVLPAGTEDVVCHPHGVPQAAALFPSTSGHCGYLVPPWTHPQESRGDRAHGEVGNRTGRVWSAVLPRHAIKSQALADFVTEWTPVPDIE
jgi:hypothetical protein